MCIALCGCSDNPAPADRAHLAIIELASLNRVLMNYQEGSSAPVPSNDFSSMLTQIGVEDIEGLQERLTSGQLFYVGGRLSFEKRDVRFLFASQFASAVFFADGSYQKCDRATKVVLESK